MPADKFEPGGRARGFDLSGLHEFLNLNPREATSLEGSSRPLAAQAELLRGAVFPPLQRP